MSRAQVVILGSGTPNADAERVGSGVAIAVDGQPYLFDCGPGIVQRVVQATASGKIAWDTTKLTRLFVTHLHADHTAGLPDLLFTPWIHGRAEKLVATGPPGLARMARQILLAYEENIREHRAAHPCSEQGYKIDAREIQPGPCYQDERVEIHALAADHGDLDAFSYKVVTSAGVVVISGDTKPAPAFAGWAKGCDVLIHEVYSSSQFRRRSSAWQRYHSRAHSSSAEVAALARNIRPGLLLLYHQLFWGLTPDELVAEVKREYEGSVISAKDLDVFDL